VASSSALRFSSIGWLAVPGGTTLAVVNET